MKLENLRQHLIAVARLATPSDAAPHAFETRVMARILEQAAADIWSLWGRLLWRGALPCVAIMLLAGAWSLTSANLNNSSDNLDADLEDAVLAPLASLHDTW